MLIILIYSGVFVTVPPLVQVDASAPSLIATLARHYDELVDHVRRQLTRFGGDRSAARDVVHDVCVELIERPFGGTAHAPLALLRTVSARRAIDRHRVESGRQAWVRSCDDPLALADAAVACEIDPQRIVAGRQRLQVLVRAIEQLPPRCRDVFVMHKLHELTQADVAQRLDITVKTVEKHLRIGTALCRQALQDAAAGEERA